MWKLQRQRAPHDDEREPPLPAPHLVVQSPPTTDAITRLEERIARVLAEQEHRLQAQLKDVGDTMKAMRSELADLRAAPPTRRPSSSNGGKPLPPPRASFASPPAGGSPQAGGAEKQAGTSSQLVVQPGAASSSPNRPDESFKVLELVQSDGEIGSMLRDMRVRMHDYAERVARREHRSDGAAPNQKADPAAEGTLYVLLVGAEGLLAADANGLSDPYCVLSLDGEVHKSKTIKKTLSPQWQEQFGFDGVLGELAREPLRLRLHDYDLLSKDDQLGEATLELQPLTFFNDVRREMVVKLDTQGSVSLQLWWEPAEGAHGQDESPGNWRASRASMILRKRARASAARHAWLPKCLRPHKGRCAVIHPDSRFRSGWNVCLAFFILYCGFAVPLEIAFETDMVDAMCRDVTDPYGPGMPRGECNSFLLWFWLNFLVDVWFIADIVLNFRTGYVHEGRLVKDDWLVAKAYLKGSFIFDVLGTFPLNMLMMILNPDNPYGDTVAADGAVSSGMDPGRANRLLRLMRMAKLLKLARMRKLAKYMENFEEFLNPGVLAVFKLVFITWFCCHLFGCMWWMVSDLEMLEEKEAADPWYSSPWYAGENTWHPPHWLKHEAALGMKYMHSFFWGAGMVTSLVPRDIEPLTIAESLITTSTMFFGLLLNAFVISSLNQALATMNSKRELTGKQLEMIKSYLLVKSTPSDLRSRILEYYDYLFSSSAALDNLNMFSNMPPSLSAQLALSTNRRLAVRCPFFREVSNASLIQLVSAFQAVVFVPAQTIQSEGTPLLDVYFINRGTVQLLGLLSARSLGANDNFGIDDYSNACVHGTKPLVTRSSRALTYCDVMALAVRTLQDVLADDPSFQTWLDARRTGSPPDQGANRLSKVARAKNSMLWTSFGKATGIGTGRSSPDPMSDLKTSAELDRHACVKLARTITGGAHAADAAVRKGGSNKEDTGQPPMQLSQRRSSFQATMLRAAERLAQGVDEDAPSASQQKLEA